MIKKLLNIGLIFLGLVFFTVLAAVVGFKLYFTEAKLKKLSGDAIRGFTSREASFGSFRYGLSWMEITDFVLSEPGSLKDGEFLKAKRIRVSQSFPPGNARVTIDSPKVSVLLSSLSGLDFTIADHSSSSDKRRHYPYFPAPASINITDGEVIFYAARAGVPFVTLKDITITAAGNASSKSFESEVKAVIDDGSAELVIESVLAINVKSGLVEVKRSRVSDGARQINIIGRVTKASSRAEKAGYEFDIEGDRVILDKVLKIMLKGRPVIQLGDKQIINLRVSGAGDSIRISEK